MGLLISFLILLLNLVILGAIYWAVSSILGVLPFIPDPLKAVLQTILKVIFVVIGVIWVAEWLIALLGGGFGGFSLPMFYHRSLRG